MAGVNELINLVKFQMGQHSTANPNQLSDMADFHVKRQDKRQADALAAQERKRKQLIEDAKRAEEKQKNRLDMYKTLREAGYTSERAFKSMESGDLPETAPANPTPITQSKSDLEGKILNKIAQDQPLTVGEQRIYDDTMKKKKPGNDFGNLKFGGDDEVTTASGEPGIRVSKPDGTTGIYNKAKWDKNKQKLIRKGWRSK